MNIAINGFGRIGRAAFKVFLEKKSNVKIVAINDLTDTKTLAHLLKYDTAYGRYGKKVECTADSRTGGAGSLIVAGKKYKVLAEKDPSKLPWREMEVDIVLECTGRFRTRQDVGLHIKAGAKKVIISAPAKNTPLTPLKRGLNEIKTIVLGVNENKISKNDEIISNASCTTNCLAPVVDIVRQNFGIKKAIMTTVHSYTADQSIVDGPHKDLRRARAAAINIVPTTTGAAIATCKAIPQLKGKFDGMAIRVPTLVGSLCDIVFDTQKKVDAKSVNNIFKKMSKSSGYRGIVEVTEEPIVSSDIIGNPVSAIVDLSLTKAIGDNLLKVIAWYDNEWGYSNRLVDLCGYMEKKRLI